MNRRKFLQTTAAGGGILLLGAGGWVISGPDNNGPATFEGMMSAIDELNGKTIRTTGQWQAAQVFEHCAQSVEYSMTGFPEHKSAAFKATAGALAFALFTAKGSMKHGLSEAIPGAPELGQAESVEVALARLKQSLNAFEQFTGPLADHFAYGTLSKQDYALAHLMHFNDHMRQITAA